MCGNAANFLMFVFQNIGCICSKFYRVSAKLQYFTMNAAQLPIIQNFPKLHRVVITV